MYQYKKTDKLQIFRKSVKSFQTAENVIKTVQQETYAQEILRFGGPIPNNNSGRALNPDLDDVGIVRVEVRLRHLKDTFP